MRGGVVREWPWATACLAAAVLLWPANAHAAPHFGFNDAAIKRASPPAGLLEKMRSVGAGVHRIDATWRAIERDQGDFDWRHLERMARQLREAGLRPLVVVRSAPRWANDQSMFVCGLGSTDPCELGPSPRFVPQWRRFVRLVAERFPDAVGFEVFNEPNFARDNWRPESDAAAYTAVLRAASEELRKVRPAAPVISGGLLNLVEGRRPGDVAAGRFLREMYAAGARGAMDAIGIHPYSTPVDARLPDSPYRRMFDELRSIRDAAGDGDVPFWITEMGYTVSTGPRGVTAKEQAELLPAAVAMAMQEPDVDAVVVHRFVDPRVDPASDEAGFGVLRPDLSPKPSFAALRDAVAEVRSSTRATPAPRRPRIRLASGKRCLRASRITIRVDAPEGEFLQNVRFAVTGGRLRRVRGGKARVRFRLGLPQRRRFRVRVSATTQRGGAVRTVRRLSRCRTSLRKRSTKDAK